MTNNNGDEQCGSAKYALKASGDKDFCSSYRVYTPQLIDIHEMRTLREAINRSEQHLQQQGHMRVYVPRVSSTANKSHQYRSLPRNYQATSKLTISADSSPRMHSGFSPLPDIKKSPLGRPTRTGAKVSEFKTALRKESRQVRELKRCYEDTKRALLDYIEVVILCKPNDRAGGQEVYEQVYSLMSYAAMCSKSD